MEEDEGFEEFVGGEATQRSSSPRPLCLHSSLHLLCLLTTACGSSTISTSAAYVPHASQHSWAGKNQVSADQTLSYFHRATRSPTSVSFHPDPTINSFTAAAGFCNWCHATVVDVTQSYPWTKCHQHYL